MLRALFGKSTNVITPEEYKAVEDQLNSKVRLLEETSRQLEQSKRQYREINEKLKISQQKQDTLTMENTSLQQQLRMAKQENMEGKPLSSSSAVGKAEDNGTSEQTQIAMMNALKQQIVQLTNENKQLKARTEVPKNNTSKNNQDAVVPQRSGTEKRVDATVNNTIITTTNTNDHNQVLWEQLQEVLTRPCSLVD